MKKYKFIMVKGKARAIKKSETVPDPATWAERVSKAFKKVKNKNYESEVMMPDKHCHLCDWDSNTNFLGQPITFWVRIKALLQEASIDEIDKLVKERDALKRKLDELQEK